MYLNITKNDPLPPSTRSVRDYDIYMQRRDGVIHLNKNVMTVNDGNNNIIVQNGIIRADPSINKKIWGKKF